MLVAIILIYFAEGDKSERYFGYFIFSLSILVYGLDYLDGNKPTSDFYTNSYIDYTSIILNDYITNNDLDNDLEEYLKSYISEEELTRDISRLNIVSDRDKILTLIDYHLSRYYISTISTIVDDNTMDSVEGKNSEAILKDILNGK